MITGATRGAGLGGALARHLLKSENEPCLLPARGLGSSALADQIRELVAQSAGGRTDRPVYHLFCSPDPAITDNAAARARFWVLFEAEFGMTSQPYCAVEHRKGGRVHEHRVYGLVTPSGRVVDMAWDYPRREKCARIVEAEFGMAPVASKHARSIEKRLRREGRHDVADRLVAAGATKAARPVARLTPQERLIAERTGIPLDDVRRATLAAWREAADAPCFVAGLKARGLDVRQGRVGPVIVDASGTAHSATRVLGAASRHFEGKRVRAAAVKTFLANVKLEGANHGSGDPAAARSAGAPAPRASDSPAAAGHGRVGVRRLGGNVVGPDGRGGGGDGGGARPALQRLRSASGARRTVMVSRLARLNMASGRYLAAAERARRAAEHLDEMASAKRDRAWALWGLTDMWGIPLT